ncbi:MAG TPA: ATP synthase F1 subunit gamma [Thermoanaerobaculia bacterium]|nr:ATP synthase F1 subunit gamma [Thermoanaerobaculia bacterium]
MANRRVLVKRRKSVRNIRKITRTMQLIATARFQAAFNRAVATKPYTEKLAELVADLSRAAGNVEHPLLQTHDDVNASALVVITSDRGLAGGYNANVLRSAVGHIEEQRGRGVAPRVHMVGRKGINFFKFLRREIAEQTTGLGDKPRFEQIEPIANDLMDRFIRGEIASAHVAYMRFHSAGVQRPAVVQLLPLSPEQQQGEEEAKPVEYEFSPDPKQLLDELLPATVRARLFQAFNDAIVSEQVARMVAMKAATDAAGDMIKALTREYNRARQTQITMELLDIVGGANALS